jgi:hypothetical protein
MRALQANGYFATILVGLEEFSDFGVVVGIVEDIGRREAVLISNLHQPLHDDFE